MSISVRVINNRRQRVVTVAGQCGVVCVAWWLRGRVVPNSAGRPVSAGDVGTLLVLFFLLVSRVFYVEYAYESSTCERFLRSENVNEYIQNSLIYVSQ